MKEYKHYIFDFDMTLFDTMQGMKQCYKSAFDAINVDYDEEKLPLFLGEDLRDTYHRYAEDDSQFSCFENAFLTTSKEYMCNSSLIYNDTYATIVQLFDCGKRLSIATGKPKDRVIEILKKHNLDCYFDYICGYGDYSNPKPSPESIEKCIEQTNISKEDTVYVGDSDNDMLAAAQARIDGFRIYRDDINTSTPINSPSTINSLLELLRNFNLCIFTVSTTQYDVFESKNSTKLLQNYCLANNYQLIRQDSFQCHIKISKAYDMFINLYGTIVITEQIPCDGLSAEDTLSLKEKICRDNLSKSDSAVQKIFYNYDNWAKSVVKKNQKKESKIAYTLVCYFCQVHIQNLVKYCSYTAKEILFLLMKYAPNITEDNNNKSLMYLLKSKDIPFTEINNCNMVSALWGSRIFVTTDNNIKFFHEYIEEEKTTQNLWMLLNANNKIISTKENITSDSHSLVTSMYEVISYEENVKYINALRKHRYQLEISELLSNTANLTVMEEYFNKKVKIIEQKIAIESSKRDKENDFKMNISLFVLTVISSISAVFQVINYWNESPANNKSSVIWCIILCIIITLFWGIRFIANKIHKK